MLCSVEVFASTELSGSLFELVDLLAGVGVLGGGHFFNLSFGDCSLKRGQSKEEAEQRSDGLGGLLDQLLIRHKESRSDLGLLDHLTVEVTENGNLLLNKLVPNFVLVHRFFCLE